MTHQLILMGNTLSFAKSAEIMDWSIKAFGAGFLRRWRAAFCVPQLRLIHDLTDNGVELADYRVTWLIIVPGSR